MQKKVTLKKGQEVINVSAARQGYYESLGYAATKSAPSEVPKEKKAPEGKVGDFK